MSRIFSAHYSTEVVGVNIRLYRIPFFCVCKANLCLSKRSLINFIPTNSYTNPTVVTCVTMARIFTEFQLLKFLDSPVGAVSGFIPSAVGAQLQLIVYMKLCEFNGHY